MGHVLFLALLAALNPTLVAATTIMLLLPNPARLMLGYWLGAMLTSITLGLVIVFALSNSDAVSTTRQAVSPVVNIVVGGLMLVVARVLASGRSSRRRARRREGKPPPRWQQMLREGSPRATFVIGAMLTLPGALYLIGLNKIHDLHYATAGTVAAVVAFNLVMMLLLEGPIVAFAIAPQWTPNAVERAKAWVAVRGRTYASRGLTILGAALVVKGVLLLIT
jgi:hypothetical protein